MDTTTVYVTWEDLVRHAVPLFDILRLLLPIRVLDDDCHTKDEFNTENSRQSKA